MSYTKKSEVRGTHADCIGERAVLIANYIVDNNSTVREAAKLFKVSKSTVHKDITYRLSYINPRLATAVKDVLETNKAERHLRGGLATKQKFGQVA